MRRASHSLRFITLPPRLVGKAPPLTIQPVRFGDVDPPEQKRIEREARKAYDLITKATQAQQNLLVRLAKPAGEDGIRFRSIKRLEAFLKDTRAFSDDAVKQLSDEKLDALWREAETHEPASLRDAPPEPELHLHDTTRGAGKPKLAVDVVGRVGPEPRTPDRVAVDAHVAGVLLDKASATQTSLIERLVRVAGPQGLRFAVVTTLAKFMAATRELTPEAAAKLSDEELAKIWHGAAKD